MKTVGLVMIFAALSLAGINKAMTITASDREAYSVISMLKYIRTLISYVSTPADKILDSLLESEYKDMFFIKDARERFRRGDSFSSAWKNAIDKNKSDTCLPQDCIEKLKAFPTPSARQTNRASSKIAIHLSLILNSGKRSFTKELRVRRAFTVLSVCFSVRLP